MKIGKLSIQSISAVFYYSVMHNMKIYVDATKSQLIKNSKILNK